MGFIIKQRVVLLPPTDALRLIVLNNASILYIILLWLVAQSQLILFLQIPSLPLLQKRRSPPMSLLPPHGTAPSNFRQLQKILSCGPQEFGLHLSPNMANHSLEPAIDHRLSKLLPHQLVNQTRAPPRAYSSSCSSAYGVLTAVFSCCSPL